MKKGIGATVLALILMPALLFAQTQNDALRSQIRADLMKDPRTSQMSQAEIDAMVSALADQAVKDGSADAYLESQNSFDHSAEFPAPEAPSALKAFLLSPLFLAILALAAVLVGVVVYIVRRRGDPEEASDAL